MELGRVRRRGEQDEGRVGLSVQRLELCRDIQSQYTHTPQGIVKTRRKRKRERKKRGSHSPSARAHPTAYQTASASSAGYSQKRGGTPSRADRPPPRPPFQTTHALRLHEFGILYAQLCFPGFFSLFLEALNYPCAPTRCRRVARPVFNALAMPGWYIGWSIHPSTRYVAMPNRLR